MQPGDNNVAVLTVHASPLGFKLFKREAGVQSDIDAKSAVRKYGQSGKQLDQEATRCARSASRAHRVIKLYWTFNDTLRITVVRWCLLLKYMVGVTSEFQVIKFTTV